MTNEDKSNEENKPRRKREKAVFAVQQMLDGDWVDLDQPEELTTTKDCIAMLKHAAATEGLTGEFRIIQIKDTLSIEVENKPTVTICRS